MPRWSWKLNPRSKEDSSSVDSLAEVKVQAVSELPLLKSDELEERPKPRANEACSGNLSVPLSSPRFLFGPMD